MGDSSPSSSSSSYRSGNDSDGGGGGSGKAVLRRKPFANFLDNEFRKAEKVISGLETASSIKMGRVTRPPHHTTVINGVRYYIPYNLWFVFSVAFVFGYLDAGKSLPLPLP